MEITEVILEEVRLVRADLKAHIAEENGTKYDIQRDVQALRVEVALNKQQGSAIVAFIAASVSTVVAALVSFFGFRQ